MNTWLTTIFRLATTRNVLLVMIVLQLLWLVGIWVTGAITVAYKLLPLLIYSGLMGLTILLLPGKLSQKLHQAVTYLSTHERPALLFLFILIFVFGSYYAVNQRLWPFDEEYSYEAAVTVTHEGVDGLFANYQNWNWLAKQHPPLAPIIIGQMMGVLGTSITMARIVPLLFSIGTGLLTFLIGSELYDKKTGIVGATFLFTFPLLMRLSATAMVEPILAFFFTLTLYLALVFIRRQSWGFLVAAAFVVGLGILTKYTMVFVLPILLGLILVRGTRKQIWQMIVALMMMVFIFALAWILIANQINVLQVQLKTVANYAGLVLTNGYGRQVLFETVTNRLPSALGVYNIPLIVLGGLVLIGRRSRADWVVLLWIAGVWLPLMLTLPDHRYFLSSFPAVALLIATVFQMLPKLLDRTVVLAILYCAGALYLYIDWSRAARLFIQ